MNSNFSHKDLRSSQKSFTRSSSPFSRNHKKISSSHSQFSENNRSRTAKKSVFNLKESPFPSQDPYTARRPNEPRMPEGISWDMLSAQDKARLRGLSKEHAKNIGLHMLAAYFLEDEDQQWALEHAKWIARQASRVEIARETLGLIAYRVGDYKLAARELRTALRMNGEIDYLPFIADCERGLQKPEKAIEIGNSEMARELRGPEKAEMMLVMAGVHADMKDYNRAIDITGLLLNAQGVGAEYRMRAAQAQQYFLEAAGQLQKAQELDELIEKLEDLYADNNFADDELLIDNDLENMSEDEVEKLASSKEFHNKEVHNKDSHSHSHSHSRDSRDKEVRNKEAHGKTFHNKSFQNKNFQGKEAHGKGSYSKGSYSKNSHNKDFRNTRFSPKKTSERKRSI